MNSTPSPSANTSQPRLSGALRQRHITMISLGGIIGAGLFVGSSATIQAIGPAAFLSYLAAGLVVMLVMRMLGEMAVALPGVGSFTEYARIGLGNWVGFTSGWLYWYFWVIVVAVEAVVGANILEQWIPLPAWVIGLGLLAIMTAINCLSVKSYGEFEYWFASLKVFAIIVFIGVLGAYLFGVAPSTSALLDNLVNDRGFMPYGVSAILAGVPTVIFAVGGAEIATIAAAESDDPSGNVANMTRSVIFRVITFYVGSIFLIVCVVPWGQIVAGHSPFVAALEVLRIPGASLIMEAVVLVAVLSALNSGLYVSSRILFGLSQRGDAPAGLSKLTGRQVPRAAVLSSSVIGYLAIMAAIISPEGVFLFLVNASGAVMLFVYLAVALAQIQVRRQVEASAPQRLTLKMWLFPWLSYAVVAVIAGVLAAMAFQESLRTQFLASLVSLGVVSAAYMLFVRRGARGGQAHVKAADLLARLPARS
ncbi:amino acid permease [Pseudomonas sp. zfem002]|uniref:amino acid permease n=1 Tax=Pseudomonas sp. zfem002 TaxID=3078197 RepID=UPI0029284252|nr:amino acid permease [Pseudomonas sp. zfem002]MDU9390021.1 amino acid permease [Pseudomonas sp. zfem002]